MASRRQPIPQFELPFASEPMALVRETAIDGQRVMAEREQSEADRKASEARQTTIYGATWMKVRERAGSVMQATSERVNSPVSESSRKAGGPTNSNNVDTMPGLAPGSSWSMAKALATMQRGTR
jgi:hypothetical protein